MKVTVKEPTAKNTNENSREWAVDLQEQINRRPRDLYERRGRRSHDDASVHAIVFTRKALRQKQHILSLAKSCSMKMHRPILSCENLATGFVIHDKRAK